MLAYNDYAKKNEMKPLLDIAADRRQKLLKQLTIDTKLLQSLGLIDYSLFLIQVDRQIMIENLAAQTPVLSFDKVKG